MSTFLPHSKLGDQYCSFSPVYITDGIDDPTNADFLFIIGASNFTVLDILNFRRTFILFNNDDHDFCTFVKKIWGELENYDIERNYWIQEITGWKQTQPA